VYVDIIVYLRVLLISYPCSNCNVKAQYVNTWRSGWVGMWVGEQIDGWMYWELPCVICPTLFTRCLHWVWNLSLYDDGNENAHSTLTSFPGLYEQSVLLSTYLDWNRSNARQCLRNYKRRRKLIYIQDYTVLFRVVFVKFPQKRGCCRTLAPEALDCINKT
jgi:hypothetical protein